ncbi:hypothetical protein IFM89_018298 [Coptis chinensis]|uniref:Uncharacterized protein n=1 Tax=Coptis chinensis TaxID=261450 RepID=A0A835GWV4_9MAGN|nr:hypothetical protein IFM89_018298 [Coptis chinensis]
MYCMEHMPDGSKGSYKRGKERFMDDTGELTNEKPLNKKGVYRLSNVQYEQVRRWVLQCSKLSIPWQKKYQIYLQRFKPSGRKRKGNTETPMSFIPWLREQVKYSAFLPAVLGFLLSVYLLKSIGSDMSGQESTESIFYPIKSSKQAEKRARKTMLSREAVMARDLNGGIHISDSRSSSSDSQVSGGGGSCVSSKGKKKVEFDSDGQPVGDGSEGFSSLLGGTTKTHCPISYESFKNVPSPTKNIIWSSVVKEYNVDDAYKKINLNKVAKSFREFKHRLRVKYYDKYDNDVDRKRNCPTGVKLEEWEKFVDNESKPSRKLMGQRARRLEKP